MARWWVLAMLCVGCGSGGSGGTSITIGAVIDRTGSIASPSWGDAIKVAVDDVNAGLTKAKSNIQFVRQVADSTNTPSVAVMRATELVKTMGAKVLIADSSSDDIAIHQLAYDADPSNDLDVPIICQACTSPAINNPMAANPMDPVNEATLQNAKGWNFRTVMSTTLQSITVMRIALAKGSNGDVNGDGQFKVSVYASDEAFGRGFAGALQKAAASLHPTPPAIVEQVFHPAKVEPNTYDWPADVAKLVDQHNENTMTDDGFPDVVMEVTFPQYDAALVKSYVQSGQTVPLLHTHATRLATVIRSAGDALEGQDGTSYVLLDNGASGDTFAQEYMTASGIAVQFLDANSYDAAVLGMLATLKAAKGLPDATAVTGAQIRDALKTLNDKSGTVIRTGPDELAKAVDLIGKGMPINYEGASGPVDFDANGNVIDRLTHWKVMGGQFVDFERYDCVGSSDCPVMQ